MGEGLREAKKAKEALSFRTHFEVILGPPSPGPWRWPQRRHRHGGGWGADAPPPSKSKSQDGHLKVPRTLKEFLPSLAIKKQYISLQGALVLVHLGPREYRFEATGSFGVGRIRGHRGSLLPLKARKTMAAILRVPGQGGQPV